ncbi:MAG: hypothetical protein ABI670_07385 [Chloroflexota bacterium]
MRKSVLMVLAMVFMVILSACDMSPATPTPAPSPTTAQVTAPTATTAAQSIAPTATTQQTTTGQATPATAGKGKIGKASAGTFTSAERPAPKGDLATRSLQVAKGTAPFESIDPARATATVGEPEATATTAPSGSATVPEDWSVVLDSDFSDGDAGTWLTGDAGDISAGVEDGTYNMVVKDGSGFYTWAEETDNWTDGYISATLKLTGPGMVGLAARVAKTDGKFSDVVCVISNSGKYGCYTELNGENTKVAAAASSAIKRNGENTLALLGVGNELTFFINGKSIKTFPADDITEGAWGAYAETGPNTTTTGSFSHIVFMGPGEEPSDVTPTAEPDVEATATTEPDVEPTATTEEVVETPTAEPDVEGTATTEPDVEATATTPAVTPTAGAGNVIVSTDFANESGTWYTGEGDGYSVAVTDGELAVVSSNAHGIVATASEESMDLADARIEAVVRIEDESSDAPGFVGISGRSQEFATDYQDWSQIFCGINNNGDYTCDRLEQSENGTVDFTELLHGNVSTIEAGQPNTIALSAKGSRWTFEINGKKIGSFTDNSVKRGAWGVLVNSGDATTTGFYSKLSVFKR